MIYNNWLVTGENMENLTLREKQIVPVAAFTANGDIEKFKRSVSFNNIWYRACPAGGRRDYRSTSGGCCLVPCKC